jgi:hypothetical protein
MKKLNTALAVLAAVTPYCLFVTDLAPEGKGMLFVFWVFFNMGLLIVFTQERSSTTVTAKAAERNNDNVFKLFWVTFLSMGTIAIVAASIL